MGKRDRSSESDKKVNKRSKKEKAKEIGKKDSEKNENESLEVSTKKVGSKAATKALSTNQKAFFLKKKIDVELSLLPSSLHNTDDAVQNSLNQLLMKYSDGLGGILLACENVRIITDRNGLGRGWILNELPWIHYTVSCDALVFRPYIGGEVRLWIGLSFPNSIVSPLNCLFFCL